MEICWEKMFSKQTTMYTLLQDSSSSAHPELRPLEVKYRESFLERSPKDLAAMHCYLSMVIHLQITPKRKHFLQKIKLQASAVPEATLTLNALPILKEEVLQNYCQVFDVRIQGLQSTVKKRRLSWRTGGPWAFRSTLKCTSRSRPSMFGVQLFYKRQCISDVWTFWKHVLGLCEHSHIFCFEAPGHRREGTDLCKALFDYEIKSLLYIVDRRNYT